MAAKKKSGRLYVRTDPDVHTRMAKCAKALGVDLNGLVNLCVKFQLPIFELTATCVADRKIPLERVKSTIVKIEQLQLEITGKNIFGTTTTPNVEMSADEGEVRAIPIVPKGPIPIAVEGKQPQSSPRSLDENTKGVKDDDAPR